MQESSLALTPFPSYILDEARFKPTFDCESSSWTIPVFVVWKNIVSMTRAVKVDFSLPTIFHQLKEKKSLEKNEFSNDLLHDLRARIVCTVTAAVLHYRCILLK